MQHSDSVGKGLQHGAAKQIYPMMQSRTPENGMSRATESVVVLDCFCVRKLLAQGGDNALVFRRSHTFEQIRKAHFSNVFGRRKPIAYKAAPFVRCNNGFAEYHDTVVPL